MDLIIDRFLRMVPIGLFTSIRDGANIWELTKKCHITYAHSSLLMCQFEEYGLITKESKGREKLLKLTPKGKKIQALFRKLLKQLRR